MLTHSDREGVGGPERPDIVVRNKLKAPNIIFEFELKRVQIEIYIYPTEGWVDVTSYCTSFNENLILLLSIQNQPA